MFPKVSPVLANGPVIITNKICLYFVRVGSHHGFDAPQDVLDHTNPHWLTFPPVHPFYQHILAIGFFVLWIICSLGNSMVLYIFLK